MYSKIEHEMIFLRKGDTIFSEGDRVDNFFILSSGSIICFKVDMDKVLPLYSVKDAGVIGEDCLLGEVKKFTYSAVANQDSKIIKIPKHEVIDFVEESSDWIGRILIDMGEKLNQSFDLINEHRIKDKTLAGGEHLSIEDEVLLKKAVLPNLSKG